MYPPENVKIYIFMSTFQYKFEEYSSNSAKHKSLSYKML